MKAKVNDISIALSMYVEQELGNKFIGFEKFLVFLAAGTIKERGDKLLVNLANLKMVSALEYIDAEGNVDVDAIYKNAKYAFDKCGKLTIDGITFSSLDLDIFMQILSNVRKSA